MAIAVTFPATSTVHQLEFSTNDVWKGTFSGVPTPASGVSPRQRLADWNPRMYRIHGGTDAGQASIALPFPTAYTMSAGLGSVAAWDFSGLNDLMQNALGRTRSVLFDPRYPTNDLWTTGNDFGLPTAAAGHYADQTYAAIASWFANMFRYYHKADDGTGLKPVGWTGATNPTPWPPPAGIGKANNGLTFSALEVLNEPDYIAENPRTTRPAVGQVTPTLASVNVGGGTLTPGTTYSYRLVSIDSNGSEIVLGPAATIVLAASNNAVRVTWSAPAAVGGLVPAAYFILGRTSGTEAKICVVGRLATGGFTFDDKGTITPSGAANIQGAGPSGYVLSPREYVTFWDTIVTAVLAVEPTMLFAGPNPTNPVSNTMPSAAGRSVIMTVGPTTGPADASWVESNDYVEVLQRDAVHKPDFLSVHNYGNSNIADIDSNFWVNLAQIITDMNTAVLPFGGTTPIWATECNWNAGNGDARGTNGPGTAWMAAYFSRIAALSTRFQSVNQFQFVQDNTYGLISETGQAVPPAGNPYRPYWLLYYIMQNFPRGSQVCTLAGIPAGIDAYAVALAPDFSKVRVLVGNSATPGETASTTTVAAGSVVVTPTAMTGIVVGTVLEVGNPATAEYEEVVVTAVTGTTFTATFLNAHGPASWTIRRTSNISVDLTLSGGTSTATRHRIIDHTTVLTNADIGGPVNDGAAATASLALNGHAVALVEFDTPAAVTAVAAEACALGRTATIGGTEARW